MKTIFRFLSTGVLTAAIVAVGATAGFGQDAAATPSPTCADIDGHNALYTKFTEVYAKKTLPEMESALSIGKEYLEKFGTCTEAFKDQIEFVKPHVARIEKEIPEARDRAKLAPFFAQFDKGLAAGNADDVLAAGKEILNVKKEDMNIAFAMALIAAEKSNAANKFKYADDAIKYSNLVSAKLKTGWKFDRTYKEGPKKGSSYIGIGDYNRAESEAAQAELNYTIAYQTFYGKKDMKTAVPLYYALSQSPLAKDDPRIYGAIGDYYIAEGAPIGDEIAKLIQQIKDATDDKVKEGLDTQVKAKIAMFNGYTERALDAYSRAHNVAKSDTPAAKAYKDNLYKIMQGLYKRRFEKDAGLDQYVSTTLSKPFPNPTTPVTPISDPEPTTTTTTGTAAPATAAPASTTAAKPPTKPMSTTGTAKTSVAKKGTR
jgi:hypothetical protein